MIVVIFNISHGSKYFRLSVLLPIKSSGTLTKSSILKMNRMMMMTVRPIGSPMFEKPSITRSHPLLRCNRLGDLSAISKLMSTAVNRMKFA